MSKKRSASGKVKCRSQKKGALHSSKRKLAKPPAGKRVKGATTKLRRQPSKSDIDEARQVAKELVAATKELDVPDKEVKSSIDMLFDTLRRPVDLYRFADVVGDIVKKLKEAFGDVMPP